MRLLATHDIIVTHILNLGGEVHASQNRPAGRNAQNNIAKEP